ncbi:hypothetical protein [Nocardioides sediminis]|uniref:hypothetical protein n=1 Tax=Nocardioides sediminis TaxID=433648 RepID=UPI00131F372E|nr:hypothetical protein [Nocardioides sediminis]
MESTWENRDLPVLESIVRLADQKRSPVGAQQLVDDTGLDMDDVQRAIFALKNENPPFIEVGRPYANGFYHLIGGVTGHARRTVGAWPTPEDLTDRLAAAFVEAAEAETEPTKKGKLRSAAEFFGGVGRDVSSEVIAKVITQGM